MDLQKENRLVEKSDYDIIKELISRTCLCVSIMSEDKCISGLQWSIVTIHCCRGVNVDVLVFNTVKSLRQGIKLSSVGTV